MNLETLILLIVFAVFCCYLVYRWQQAVVDMADPPYQEPVKTELDTSLNPKAAWPFPSGDKP